jgi:hypothetical protein
MFDLATSGASVVSALSAVRTSIAMILAGALIIWIAFCTYRWLRDAIWFSCNEKRLMVEYLEESGNADSDLQDFDEWCNANPSRVEAAYAEVDADADADSPPDPDDPNDPRNYDHDVFPS